MLSLLLTLFISLFSVGSSVYPIEDHQENIIYINDTKLIKNAFANENGEGNGYEYCYTQSDLCNIQSLNGLLSYCQSYIGTDIRDRLDYYCPIKPLNVGVWSTFDYASGYDWVIHEVFTANFINLYKVTYDDYLFYTFNFLSNTTNPGRFYRFLYYISKDFDYMLSVSSSWSSTSGLTGDTNMVALYGDTADLALYQSLYDILGFDRGGAGYEAGYQNGYSYGVRVGDYQGYNRGYQEGLVDGASIVDYNTTALTIFNGIFDVGLLPVNVFLTIFNFELFGVNIAGIVSGLLTLSVVIIIVRFLLGGKKDD